VVGVEGLYMLLDNKLAVVVHIKQVHKVAVLIVVVLLQFLEVFSQ
jgi:hypothetical protein